MYEAHTPTAAGSLTFAVRGVVYVCRTEDDVRRAIADIDEQTAQREAIAKRWLHWDPVDEPAGFSNVPIRI